MILTLHFPGIEVGDAQCDVIKDWIEDCLKRRPDVDDDVNILRFADRFEMTNDDEEGEDDSKM